MQINVQNCYDIQYLTMRLSGYMNAPTEPTFIAPKHGMEYLMHHMKPSCTQERKFIKMKESPTNVTSNQDMKK